MFGESLLYFYRNRDRFSDWQAVVIYPSRSMEQTDSYPYRAMLNSDQMHRIYLNELGEFRQLPLGVALMVLTTLTERQAPDQARYLLAQSQQPSIRPEFRDFIIEMVGRIISYKLDSLNREEVEAMLDISFEETRVYRDLKEDAKAAAVAEVTAEVTAGTTLKLVLRQLTRRFKQELPEEARSQITALSVPQLEALAEALVDFEHLNDLTAWLEQHQAQ